MFSAGGALVVPRVTAGRLRKLQGVRRREALIGLVANAEFHQKTRALRIWVAETKRRRVMPQSQAADLLVMRNKEAKYWSKLRRNNETFSSTIVSAQILLAEALSAMSPPGGKEDADAPPEEHHTLKLVEVLKSVAGLQALPQGLQLLLETLALLIHRSIFYRVDGISAHGPLPFYSLARGAEHVCDDLRGVIAQLREQEAAVRAGSDEVRAALEAVEQEIAQADARRDELRVSVRSLQRKQGEQQEAGETTRQKLQQHTVKTDILHAEVRRLQNAVHERRIRLQDKEAQLIEAHSRAEAFRAMETDGLASKAAVTAVLQKIEAVEQATIELRTSHQQRLQAKVASVRELGNEQKQLESALKRRDATISRLEERRRAHTPRPHWEAAPEELSVRTASMGKVGRTSKGRIAALMTLVESTRSIGEVQLLLEVRHDIQVAQARTKIAIFMLKQLCRTRLPRPSANPQLQQEHSGPLAPSTARGILSLVTVDESGVAFQGLGYLNEVPRFLQFIGPVPLRPMSKGELQAVVKEVFKAKREFDSKLSFQQVVRLVMTKTKPAVPIAKYLYTYLRQKHTSHRTVVQWGYNLVFALAHTAASDSFELELLQAILSGKLADETTEELYSVMTDLRRFVMSISAAEKSGRRTDVLRSNLVGNLQVFFPHKQKKSLATIKTALTDLLPPVVNIESLFATGGEGEAASPVADQLEQLVCSQHLKEVVSVFDELEDALRAAATTGTTVISTTIPTIFQERHPHLSLEEIYGAMAVGLNCSPSEVYRQYVAGTDKDESCTSFVNVQKFMTRLRTKGLVRLFRHYVPTAVPLLRHPEQDPVTYEEFYRSLDPEARRKGTLTGESGRKSSKRTKRSASRSRGSTSRGSMSHGRQSVSHRGGGRTASKSARGSASGRTRQASTLRSKGSVSSTKSGKSRRRSSAMSRGHARQSSTTSTATAMSDMSDVDVSESDLDDASVYGGGETENESEADFALPRMGSVASASSDRSSPRNSPRNSPRGAMGGRNIGAKGRAPKAPSGPAPAARGPRT